MKSRSWMILAGLAAAAFSTAPAQAETTLRVLFGGDPPWVAAYQKAAAAFEAKNPGVKLKLMHTPHASYNDQVAAAVMAKDLPDILQIDAPYLSNYVWSGLLQPIEPHLDSALVADMTPSNRAQSTYPIDGKLYATSLLDSTVVLYANKTYLAAIGARVPTSVDTAWSRAEFEKILADLAKLKGVEWPLDLFRSYGSRSEWVTYAYSPIFQSLGCDLIDRKTWVAAGTLDGKVCVEAGTMIQNWVKNGWVVPGSAAANVFYADGQKAALAWGSRTYYSEAVKQMGDNVVALPLPKFGDRVAAPNGTWIWGISKTTKAPDIAGKFLSFLLADAGYRQVALDFSQTPALNSFVAAYPLYRAGGPLAIGMEQAAKAAVTRPGHPAYPAITEAFKTAMSGIFAGQDVQAELTKAARAIDLEIKDNDGFPPFGAKK